MGFCKLPDSSAQPAFPRKVCFLPLVILLILDSVGPWLTFPYFCSLLLFSKDEEWYWTHCLCFLATVSKWRLRSYLNFHVVFPSVLNSLLIHKPTWFFNPLPNMLFLSHIQRALKKQGEALYDSYRLIFSRASMLHRSQFPWKVLSVFCINFLTLINHVIYSIISSSPADQLSLGFFHRWWSRDHGKDTYLIKRSWAS